MTQTLPTVDLPGTWRWKDSYYHTNSRRLSLQRKGRWFWHTVAWELYFPMNGAYSFQHAVEECIKGARYGSTVRAETRITNA